VTLAEQLRPQRTVALMAHVHGLAEACLLSADAANEALGALAEGLGVGASVGRGERDLASTAFRLWTRDAILDIATLLLTLRQALTERADRAGDRVAPEMAPPILLGHALIAYVEQFYRDGNRLKEVYVRADILPLGAGDGAGVEILLDRGYVARLLGMHANTRNSVDGAVDRDFAIECLAALALIGARAARLLGDRACSLTPADPNIVAELQALATESADAWRAATLALASTAYDAPAATDAIDAALFDAAARTEAALQVAIQAVQEGPLGAGTLDSAARPALERFVSRGGTAPTAVRGAIQDTFGRIDTYHQWIAERSAAHPTIEQLCHFPSDRQPTLLPHG
jgi:hypothetical protein